MSAVALAFAMALPLLPVEDEPEPDITDLHRFPPMALAEEVRWAARREVDRLKAQRELFPWDHDLTPAIRGWEYRERCWDLLYYAHRSAGWGGDAGDYLRRLRDEVGREAWYAGRLP